MQHPELDKEFVEAQRVRLEEIRSELRRELGESEEERREKTEEEQDATMDASDSSAYLFDKQLDATVERRQRERLGVVERALEKIEEGTYGICDDTGQPIERGRLEAVPEAIYTIEAQRRREGSA